MPGSHEIVEDNFARALPKAKQARRLCERKRESRHFRIRVEDKPHEMRAGRLAADCAARCVPAVTKSPETHRSSIAEPHSSA
jgi:hypothetical protein